jgi:hypothetical protein
VYVSQSTLDPTQTQEKGHQKNIKKNYKKSQHQFSLKNKPKKAMAELAQNR